MRGVVGEAVRYLVMFEAQCHRGELQVVFRRFKAPAWQRERDRGGWVRKKGGLGLEGEGRK